MREEGIEPSRPFGQGILSPSRLPVPPLSRKEINIITKLFKKAIIIFQNLQNQNLKIRQNFVQF